MNRTELRHQVLAFVASGPKVQYYCAEIANERWAFGRTDFNQLAPEVKRTLNQAALDGYIASRVQARIYEPRPVSLTRRGVHLLAEWDEKYGPVTP